MSARFLLWLAIAALPAWGADECALTVIVKDAAGGDPVNDVSVNVAGVRGISAPTDEYGRYRFPNLPAGAYRITAANGLRSVSQIQRTTLLCDQPETSLEFRFPAPSSIAGRVLDEKGQPVPGISVRLVRREYQRGALEYVAMTAVTTGSQGEYTIPGYIQPGRAYLVLAGNFAGVDGPISTLPSEPELRDSLRAPAYYPDAKSPDAARPVVLGVGEARKGVDIRISKSASYCVSGTVDVAGGPASLKLWLRLAQPSIGVGSWPMYPAANGAFDMFRLCGLPAGDYWLSAETPLPAASAKVTIRDGDVSRVKLSSSADQTLLVETAWAGEPPEKPGSTANLFITNDNSGMLVQFPVPGQHSLPLKAPMGDQLIDVDGLPSGQYVKDITAAGVSVLHGSFPLAGAEPIAVRVLLARDGGFLNVLVTDHDGKPVPDVPVHVFPVAAATPAALALLRTAGRAGDDGAYASATLPPGTYYVLAGNSPVDNSPESIARLWNARNKAGKVEITGGATAHLKVEPVTID